MKKTLGIVIGAALTFVAVVHPLAAADGLAEKVRFEALQTSDAELQNAVELIIRRDFLTAIVAAHRGVRASATAAATDIDREKLADLAIATVRDSSKFARDICVLDMFPDGRGDPLYNPIWTCVVRYWTPKSYYQESEGYVVKRDVYVRVDGTWRGANGFEDLLL